MIQPLVSVILSAYNAEKYIAQSIDSVLNQTYKNFEFLIVEDYSTDATLMIIEKKAQLDSRIQWFKKDKNNGFIGYVENLNRMIQQAKGKYIAKFDADDIWREDKLEKQVYYLEENPDIFLLGSNAIKIDENDKEIGRMILPLSEDDIKLAITNHNPICHPSIIFRNEGVFYRDKMYYSDDYDLYLRLLSKGKRIINSSEFLLKYRVLPNSMSRGNKMLTQALFKEKAKTFYFQRLAKGYDDYDTFNPDEYLKILNINVVTTKPTLNLALKFAFIANLQDDFKILFKKAIKQKELLILAKYTPMFLGFSICYSVYKRFY